MTAAAALYHSSLVSLGFFVGTNLMFLAMTKHPSDRYYWDMVITAGLFVFWGAVVGIKAHLLQQLHAEDNDFTAGADTVALGLLFDDDEALDTNCPALEECLWIREEDLSTFKATYELWGYHLMDGPPENTYPEEDNPDHRHPIGVDYPRSFGFEIVLGLIFVAAFAYFRKMKARIAYLCDMAHEQDIKWVIAQDWEGAAKFK